MSVYTVHEPPLRAEQATVDPEQFVFVRDGFYVWAFLFGPLWMIWRRLWLVLVLYLVAVSAVTLALSYAGATLAVQSTISFLIALLVGFEAGTLRHWTLARRGWRMAGVAVGDDLESAEHGYFASWVAREAALPQPETAVPTAAAITAVGPAHLPPPTSTIVGLFPEPGERR